MKRPLLFFFLVLLALPAPAGAGIFGGGGGDRIRRILRSAPLAGTNAGVKAVDLAAGRTVFEENGEKLFIPASNVKLLTAYAALKLLSPRYTFTTEIAADAFIDTGTVRTLCLKGRGDPSLALSDLALQALALAGRITAVKGDIVVDGTYFDDLRFGRGWMWDEGIASWNAPITACAVNGNCVDIYVGPGPREGSPAQVRAVPATAYAVVVASAVTAEADDITIRREETAAGDRFIVMGSVGRSSPERLWKCAVSRPGLYAGTLLKELLARCGVTVSGRVCEGPLPEGTVSLGRSVSRPLGEITRAFLKDSDNLAGECLLKTLGAERSSPPGDAAKGIAAVKQALASAGIPENAYELADGSGLSTYNRFSPAVAVRVLEAAWRDLSIFPEFIDALSAAGADGTLRARLAESPLAGRVRAKSGTLSGVSCISGYLQTRKGRLLAVSIMMNGYTGSSQPLKVAQDEILKVLWEEY